MSSDNQDGYILEGDPEQPGPENLVVVSPEVHRALSQRGTPGIFAREQTAVADASSKPVGADGAPFRIILDGKQLHITASVDLNGLKLLKQVLNTYETMLQLLEPPVSQQQA